MKRTATRNQCASCGEYFNSVGAFDKHRTGHFGVDRRCRTEDEMLAAGMCKNAAGYWVTAAFEGGHWTATDDSEGGEE